MYAFCISAHFSNGEAPTEQYTDTLDAALDVIIRLTHRDALAWIELFELRPRRTFRYTNPRQPTG